MGAVLELFRSAHGRVVAELDRSRSGRVLSVSFAAGAAWGVVARVWMRYVTTNPEFSWPGTLFIVIGFAVAFVGQAGVYLARRRPAGRTGFFVVRLLAVVTLLPLSFGAGAFGFPVIVLTPPAVIRRGWNRWLRVSLGALVVVVVGALSASFLSELDLARAVFGTVWFVAIYAVLVWVVCFSFAGRDDERFTQRITHAAMPEAVGA